MYQYKSQRKWLSVTQQAVLDDEPVEIIPNLYLGSCFASYNKEALLRLHVKYIVNCSGQENMYGNVCEHLWVDWQDFVYLRVRVKDREDFNILTSLFYSVDFIAEGLRVGSVFVYW